METWTVVDKKVEPKGQQLIGRKVQQLHGRRYLNLTRVLFKALGTAKTGRTESELLPHLYVVIG